MALGRGLTSVRGNRGKKIVKNGPLVRQKHIRKKKELCSSLHYQLDGKALTMECETVKVLSQSYTTVVISYVSWVYFYSSKDNCIYDKEDLSFAVL
jgi:hypothetical protein